MQIFLNSSEVYEVLKEKYGEAVFSLMFCENDEGRRRRTGIDLNRIEKAPNTRSATIHIDKEVILIASVDKGDEN